MRLVGEPTGIADFGGADFDDIVLRHVIVAAGLSASGPDCGPRARASRSRRCAANAWRPRKPSRSIPKPSFPCSSGRRTRTVRLTRAEFEEMVDDGVERTIDVLGMHWMPRA